jgi:hypothetical protein
MLLSVYKHGSCCIRLVPVKIYDFINYRIEHINHFLKHYAYPSLHSADETANALSKRETLCDSYKFPIQEK